MRRAFHVALCILCIRQAFISNPFTSKSMSTTTTALPAPTATCTHPKPGKNGYLPPDACDVILYYVPSLGAAILFTVLFGLTLIAFGVQAFIYRKVLLPFRTLISNYLPPTEIFLGYHDGRGLGVSRICVPCAPYTESEQRWLQYRLQPPVLPGSSM